MAKVRIIHECNEETADIFYCYAVGGTADPEAKETVDWYVREDYRYIEPSRDLSTVSCITYCPFCGTELPLTKEDAVGDTYRLETVQDDDDESPLDHSREEVCTTLYLVRWSTPQPSICLVSAADEAHVLRLMDQIGDPSYCRVEEYHGPLEISIDLNFKYHRAETKVAGVTERHTVVDGVDECVEVPKWEMFTTTEQGLEMKEQLIRLAFPNYSAYIEELWGRDDEEFALGNEARCKAAIQEDFDTEERRIAYLLSEPEKDGGQNVGGV